jgi:heme-degrading monooxygenase HmoA
MQQLNRVKYKSPFQRWRKKRRRKKILLEFFKANELIISGLIQFLITHSETDPKESIVLTFWKSKEPITRTCRS